ncbi:hypothetical protein TRIUR3_17364 [Triticum urartu]|uniref:Uncharacterized protein n=1 Tax=Triticum urartu TaxID=4572 RepID=M7Z9K9_TRIUA|nr:hypothetical protein TRIUR3_17364 [Triticum urartu]
MWAATSRPASTTGPDKQQQQFRSKNKSKRAEETEGKGEVLTLWRGLVRSLLSPSNDTHQLQKAYLLM